MRDPEPQLQQDTAEDVRYMESHEEHESKPSAGDEPKLHPLFSETLSQFSRLHRSHKNDF